MMPIDLWNQLVDALTDDVRIILIGDINQLPPVQGRSVLGFAMTKWPTFTLEKIHRQAADNPIIANAHRILRGEMPEKVPGVFDMVMMPNKDIDCYNKCIQAIKLLHGKKQFDPIQDGFIVPMNDYQLGQRTFNEILVGYFNPVREVEGIKINPRIAIATGMNQVVYSVGDKVMLLQNDRDRGLTNGMIGIVTEINLNGNYDGRRPGAENFDTSQDEHIEELNMEEFALEMEQKQIEIKEDDSATQRQASHITTVQFADEEVKFQTAGDYRKLTHAYAFTCHKSQGGEYPTVIILCHSATSLRMLSREWLYTAVTRARQRVVLLYNERGLKQAIGTQRIKGKTVAEKAESFIALQDKKDVNIPILWEPKELNPGD
jgi:exodeoxyribonuclease V alpha subunit